MSKFVTTTYGNKKDILKFPDHYVALAVTVDDTDIVANADGKKIVLAGTPVGGVSAPTLTDASQMVQKKNTAPVKASATLDCTNANADITITAVVPGTTGNAISVELVNPGVVTQALEVDLVNNKVVVNLGTTYVPAVPAVLAMNSGDANGDITFTAVNAGTAGNAIKVLLLDPAGNDKVLGVDLIGDTVEVSLATSGAGAITSTAAQVVAAVNASLEAKSLVVASNTGESTGASVVTAVAATPLAGGVAASASIASTAAQVIAAVNASLEARELVVATNATGSSGVGVVNAVVATALTGGSNGVSGAEGLLMSDVDVTYGPAPGAMLIHGFVAIGKLPEAPTPEVVAALKQIAFIA